MSSNTTNHSAYPELRRGAIAGVGFRELKTFSDNRGFFREVMRRDDPLIDAELDSAEPQVLAAGAVLGWQLDPHRAQWWYVPVGTLKVGLYDSRPASATFGYIMEVELDELKAAQVVKIPAGVACTCQASALTQLVQFNARLTEASQVQVLPANHVVQQFQFTL